MDKMNYAGHNQGDMSPKVEDYQTPMSAFSQEGFSKTTQYIERQDKQRNMAAKDVEKQAYRGRYS
jgi:hypothetical protein